MVSKELLSSIWNKQVDEVFYYNDNLIWFEIEGEEYQSNIYELAYIAKQWVRDNFSLEIISCAKITTINYCYDLSVTPLKTLIHEKNELEAVFKAAQFILDEYNK